jgi:RND superfamily putative drug exporter
VARHARAVLVFWVLFIVAGFGLATGAFGTESLFDRLHSGEIVVPGENADGRAVLREAGASGFSTYTLTIEGVDLHDPAVATAAVAAVKDLTAIGQVESAVNPFVLPGGPSGPAATPLLGAEGASSGAFATVVTYRQDLTRTQEQAAQEEVDAVFDDLVQAVDPARSDRGGIRALVDRVIAQVRIDGQTGEGVALPISFLVMIVVFGGFLAAGYPVFGAIASIAGALASLVAFSHWLDLDAAVVNVVTVLGLGLCIDYGLLVVSRFREELATTRPAGLAPGAELTRDVVHQAAEHTLDRAGRTVIFSAITVAIALGGLAVLDVEFVRAVAAAGVSVVLVALAVAISLIPALCVLGARRLGRRARDIGGDHGVFSRLARLVQRFPWAIIVAVTAGLVVVALPSLDLRLTSSGAELLPKGTPEREFFDNARAVFPRLGGADVAVVTTADPATVEDWLPTATSIPGVRSVDPPTPPRDGVVVVGLRTGDGGLGDDSRRAVQFLRDHRPPFTAWTVGQASSVWDFQRAIAQRAPLAVGLVMLATFVLLFLMTGSVVIPVKAILMNIGSLGACLGVLVWVFQDGHLASVLGFTPAGGIEATMPLLVLAFGFGLSMDYEVFLLSRIVELHAEGRSTDEAVALGLQRSGRIITSAALLMVIVFAGFAAGKLLMIKQMGLGLVMAVVIDATLVRMLLVPATMTVLGRLNWWAPAPLRRLHARWGITH